MHVLAAKANEESTSLTLLPHPPGFGVGGLNEPVAYDIIDKFESTLTILCAHSHVSAKILFGGPHFSTVKCTSWQQRQMKNQRL